MKHLHINAHDCTPPDLVCPEFSEVQETQGLDIPEEKHHDHY